MNRFIILNYRYQNGTQYFVSIHLGFVLLRILFSIEKKRIIMHNDGYHSILLSTKKPLFQKYRIQPTILIEK